MEWEDEDILADFGEQALTVAKRFTRNHSWEDRGAVFSAAQEAALQYESSQRLRSGFAFEVWCYLRIRTVLYISKRQSKKTKGRKAKEARS
ncbi:MAG: hypothetical protein NC084_09805 [Bacteroides sp.]|nr:hypothetical protein [Eubacterium sp.]MCM1419421.1 hypothetical protein [Roseburia sp.]MCM1462992.1 hypothetical protein [Bacteroides sp.]